MRIFAFHLLNDYSGSPKVLMQLAKGWIQNGSEVHLISASGRTGFLSNIEGVYAQSYWYRWAANPWLRLCNLIISQCILFGKAVVQLKKEDVVYINTVLPFGAAFAGRIRGCKVIYHIHETSIKPILLKKILFGMAKMTATEVIYVSNFLAEQEPFHGCPTHVLHNAIEADFLKKATEFTTPSTTTDRVLMVCSLKDYKGIHEFVLLAKDNPAYRFRLVVNSVQVDLEHWLACHPLTDNLTVFPTQTNLHPFYEWANVIVNLSRPDGWIETFGLTIIEGMAYGLPAIVPPVGGITELVEIGKNGFQIDCRDREALNSALQKILNNKEEYQKMQHYSRRKIQQFSEATFIQKNCAIIGLPNIGVTE